MGMTERAVTVIKKISALLYCRIYIASILLAQYYQKYFYYLSINIFYVKNATADNQEISYLFSPQTELILEMYIVNQHYLN